MMENVRLQNLPVEFKKALYNVVVEYDGIACYCDICKHTGTEYFDGYIVLAVADADALKRKALEVSGIDNTFEATYSLENCLSEVLLRTLIVEETEEEMDWYELHLRPLVFMRYYESFTVEEFSSYAKHAFLGGRGIRVNTARFYNREEMLEELYN